MKIENLEEVKKLCAELGDMIHVATNKTQRDFKYDSDFESYDEYLSSGNLIGGKDAAAIKRKSMDLTRALSKMRQE